MVWVGSQQVRLSLCQLPAFVLVIYRRMSLFVTVLVVLVVVAP